MQIIYLDISNKGVVPTIYAKQGDVGRKVQVIFMDSGIPYEIPKNAGLSVWYDGDSGDGNYTDIGNKSAIVVENNKVTFELITQMLNNDGEGIVCLIMNVGEEQIGSWNIPYICEKVPGFESEVAKEYYTAFSESVKKLKQVTENLTPKAIGAAPSGYGLGEYAAQISDLNSLTGGLYKWDAAAENRPFDYGTAIVIGRDSNSGSEICIGVTGTYKGVVAVRTKNSEGWIEEYINPPMTLNVEYRTTERHNGKPVYVQLVDFESLPANNYKEKQFTTDYVTNVVEINAVASHDGIYRRVETLSGVTDLSVKRSVGQALVTVTTNTVLSQYYAYITIKYTKD